MSEQNAKIIQLPIKQKKTSEEQSFSLLNMTPSSGLRFYQKKKIKLVLSLITTVIVVTMTNYALFERSITGPGSSDRSASASRSIASVGTRTGSMALDRASEQKLLLHLKENPGRGPASVGRVSPIMDQLQFGFLMGKYILKTNSGNLDEIIFSSHYETPVKLMDRPLFMKEYKNLLIKNWEESRFMNRTIKENSTIETYALWASNEKQAEVSFELDSYERLLSLNVFRFNQ